MEEKGKLNNIGIAILIDSISYSNDWPFLGTSIVISEELLISKNLTQQKFNRSIYFFRPPYGFSTPFLIKECNNLNLTMITWDVFPRDYKKNSSQIISYINNSVTKGSIIVLHDGKGNKSQMLNALPRIINLIQKKGYKFDKLDNYRS